MYLGITQYTFVLLFTTWLLIKFSFMKLTFYVHWMTLSHIVLLSWLFGLWFTMRTLAKFMIPSQVFWVHNFFSKLCFIKYFLNFCWQWYYAHWRINLRGNEIPRNITSCSASKGVIMHLYNCTGLYVLIFSMPCHWFCCRWVCFPSHMYLYWQLCIFEYVDAHFALIFEATTSKLTVKGAYAFYMEKKQEYYGALEIGRDIFHQWWFLIFVFETFTLQVANRSQCKHQKSGHSWWMCPLWWRCNYRWLR